MTGIYKKDWKTAHTSIVGLKCSLSAAGGCSSCPLQPVVMAARFLCDSEALASPWGVATGIHGLLWPGDVSSKVARRALYPRDGQAHCPVCVASGQRRPSGPRYVKPVVNRGPCQSSVPSLYQGSGADTRFLASLASSPALFTGACNSLRGRGAHSPALRDKASSCCRLLAWYHGTVVLRVSGAGAAPGPW